MRLQIRSMGSWIDCDDADFENYIQDAVNTATIKHENAIYNFEQGGIDARSEFPKMTQESIIAKLAAGESVDTQVGRPGAPIRSADHIPAPASVTEQMVKCDCGHTVPRSAVMNASLGTSCPQCYDRMSD